MRVPEHLRVKGGLMGSSEADGNNGAFLLVVNGVQMQAIASDGLGWEHVSVSTRGRCPTWEEMSYAKGLFWEPEDVVIQFHPAASEYVNIHPTCLHLWRPRGRNLPLPPTAP